LIHITTVGERLLVKARQILDETREIDDIVASAATPLCGPLRLGIIATLGPYLMPHVLAPMRRRYPDLELVLHEGLTDALVAALQMGTLDVVIAAAPLHAAGLEQRALFHEPFLLAVPTSHGLAGQLTINAADLSGEDMVLLEDGHCLSGQALDVCPAKQRQNRNRLHALTLETLRHMVASGAGYTLLPSLAVGDKPPLSKLIRYRKLGGKRQYGRRIVLVWRKSYGRDADIDHLARLIGDAIPSKYDIHPYS
jgi:LysR family hydrogen peroxide-inducible transcriptional activator